MCGVRRASLIPLRWLRAHAEEGLEVVQSQEVLERVNDCGNSIGKVDWHLVYLKDDEEVGTALEMNEWPNVRLAAIKFYEGGSVRRYDEPIEMSVGVTKKKSQLQKSREEEERSVWSVV